MYVTRVECAHTDSWKAMKFYTKLGSIQIQTVRPTKFTRNLKGSWNYRGLNECSETVKTVKYG
jgi:hypothetical protein